MEPPFRHTDTHTPEAVTGSNPTPELGLRVCKHRNIELNAKEKLLWAGTPVVARRGAD